MSNLRSLLLVGGLMAFAQAFTQPSAQTWGPLLTPNLSSPVTQDQTATITWDPENHSTDGVTVSLVLCRGPGSNCVLASSAIAERIPAAQRSYSWQVPCSLTAGTQQTSSGYGMLVIVDGTGEFQYSTQFSVLENPSCATSSSASSSASVSPTTNGTTVVITSTGVSSSSASGSSSSPSSSLATRTITSTNSNGTPESTSLVTTSTMTEFPSSTTVTPTGAATDQTYSSGATDTAIGTTIHGGASPSSFTDAAPAATAGVMGAFALGAVAMLVL